MHDNPPKTDFIVKRHMYVSIESAISTPMYVNEKRNIKRFEKKKHPQIFRSYNMYSRI